MSSPRSIRLTLGGTPRDPVLAAVRDALADSYSILGELGKTADVTRALLVRSRASATLEVALLRTVPNDDSVELVFVDHLDATIPANAVPCPFCDRALRVWGRYCTRCGEDLSGLSASGVGMTNEELLEYIREMAGEAYEVLGSISRREGGGEVYFARETDNARLVALRFEAQAGTTATDARYTLGVSGTVSDVSATPASAAAPAKEASRVQQDVPRGGAPTDLLKALQQQTEGEFEVLGEIGRIGPARFFLARELASEELVALRLVAGGDGFTVAVHRRLERRRTAHERSLAGERLRVLSKASGGDYEFIGEMEHSDASTAYFARRRSDGAIVGVRCEAASSFGDEDAVAMREIDALRAVTEPAAERVSRQPSHGHTDRTPDAPPVREPVAHHPRAHVSPDSASGKSVSNRLLVPGVLAVVVALLALVVAFGSCA